MMKWSFWGESNSITFTTHNEMNMQPIDLAIIVFFLLGNTLFGLWHGKSNKSSRDYFLGNKNLPWIASMLSIVASETSVLTFVSVPGLAYRGDWSFLQLAMGYIVGRVLVLSLIHI